MKKYVIIGQPANINFSEVDQDNLESCTDSILKNEFVVSYDGNMPPSVAACQNKSEEYDKDSLIEFILSPDWTVYGFLDPDPSVSDDVDVMRTLYQQEL